MLLVPQRLECVHRRMQSKEAIKVKHALARDGDAGPHVVIRLLTVRYNNVQTVGGAALKENNQAIPARSRGFRGVYRARKKAGNHAGADNGQHAVLQKNSASNGHALSLSAVEIPVSP